MNRANILLNFKGFVFTAIFVLCIQNSLYSQNSIQPPKIIKTIPEFGDWNVDPNLKEVVIEFDQEMQPGMSVLNSPNLVGDGGKPFWKNSHVFIIPVKIEPDHLYQIPGRGGERECHLREFRGAPVIFDLAATELADRALWHRGLVCPSERRHLRVRA